MPLNSFDDKSRRVWMIFGHVSSSVGHVTLVAITGATILVPCHVAKSLQLIWRLGHLQISSMGAWIFKWVAVTRLDSLRPSDAYMHHWFRWWLVAWLVPRRYLNQCWNIGNRNPRNKLQWNFNRNSCIFIHKNPFENVVWKMQPFCRPQYVKDGTPWLCLHINSVHVELKIKKFLIDSVPQHWYAFSVSEKTIWVMSSLSLKEGLKI